MPVRVGLWILLRLGLILIDFLDEFVANFSLIIVSHENEKEVEMEIILTIQFEIYLYS